MWVWCADVPVYLEAPLIESEGLRTPQLRAHGQFHPSHNAA